MRIFSASIQRILSKSNPNTDILNSTTISTDEIDTDIVNNEELEVQKEKIFTNPVYDYSHLEEYEQYQNRRETHLLDMSDW